MTVWNDDHKPFKELLLLLATVLSCVSTVAALYFVVRYEMKGIEYGTGCKGWLILSLAAAMVFGHKLNERS